MNKLFSLLIAINICTTYVAFSQCQYGDPCMRVNTSCLDASQYPVISNLVTAGVVGGIPNTLVVVNTIDNTDDIQTAIDNAFASGGGVILLNPGVYEITSTIRLKSNVVLRGVDSNTVIIESSIRSTWEEGKKNTIEFNTISNSGIENLTILYKVAGYDPIDRLNWLDGGWCGDCFKNDPHGLDNLYVRQVAIDKFSTNCWVDGCNILKSGTDPILIAGNHNTLRNNVVDQSYNKGGAGNGYYDIRGDYNLIANETIKRVRHLAIQQGAAYNVIINCDIEGDVNFHNGDDGNNLLENNQIKLPTWHGWDIFGTGGAIYGHLPPGAGNIMVNNTTNYKNQGPRYSDANVIYTFSDYGTPDTTTWSMPTCNTFYPLENNSLKLKKNSSSNKNLVYPNPTSNKLFIKNTLLSKKNIKIYDILGKEVDFTMITNQNNIELDISNLNAGFYIIRTKTSARKVYKN